MINKLKWCGKQSLYSFPLQIIIFLLIGAPLVTALMWSIGGHLVATLVFCTLILKDEDVSE